MVTLWENIGKPDKSLICQNRSGTSVALWHSPINFSHFELYIFKIGWELTMLLVKMYDKASSCSTWTNAECSVNSVMNVFDSCIFCCKALSFFARFSNFKLYYVHKLFIFYNIWFVLICHINCSRAGIFTALRILSLFGNSNVLSFLLLATSWTSLFVLNPYSWASLLCMNVILCDMKCRSTGPNHPLFYVIWLELAMSWLFTDHIFQL